MKSKEEILESGILEQYVLGLTDDQETRLVQEYIRTYPELKDHVDTIERAMEIIAKKHAIVPPEHLREATLKKIREAESFTFEKGKNKWKWISGIAAGVCLMAVLHGWNTQNKINEITYNIKDLQQKLVIADRDCALIKEDFDIKSRLLQMYMNESTTPVRLLGNEQLPGADLVVFWNSGEQKAHLKINFLVDPPEDHIYQIWADVKGEMISLGTFFSINDIITINYLENAESLNVTIEKGSGSDHPSVDKLVMSSKV